MAVHTFRFHVCRFNQLQMENRYLGDSDIGAYMCYAVRPMRVASVLNMYKLFCHYSLKYSITIYKTFHSIRYYKVVYS